MFSRKSDYIIATPGSESRNLRRKRLLRLTSLALLSGAIILVARQWEPAPGPSVDTRPQDAPDSAIEQLAEAADEQEAQLDKAFLRGALSEYIKAGQFPSQLGHEDQNIYINYTLDPNLQNWAEERLQRYNPDYGAFVALDPDTGKILAMASSRRDQQQSSDLPLNATYPAASIFKVITAAATIEEGIATPQTVFAFNGKSTSLYKNQVYQVKENKWTRRMSFKTAFAKSVNPIFGRLGAKELGPQTLLD